MITIIVVGFGAPDPRLTLHQQGVVNRMRRSLLFDLGDPILGERDE